MFACSNPLSVRGWSCEAAVVGGIASGHAEWRLTMAFIQSIEFSTDQQDAVVELMRRWSADAIGNGTAQRATMAGDRSTSGRFVIAVSFESAEAAGQNSARPETGAFAEQFASLCSDGPTYREFDVVEVFRG